MERLQARLQETKALVRMSQEARARAQATRDQILRGRSQRQVLHDSAFARLQAKHETIAVIEQAKGIIMARQGCGPEEAFDLLRQVSQRTNVKVHVLASQMVEQIASGHNGGKVTPIWPGVGRYPRSGTQAQPPAV
jgi:ANTAR domain